jgi:all-trans-8'-apo-beta-carotenal 15,15'-oxygenase
MQAQPKNTSTPTEQSYTREDWQLGYQSLKQEYDYWIEDIEGEIPPELNGTLFRNGPGLLDINGQNIHHPFDGDGMICRITLNNGRAHFSNRYVRTPGYVEEQKAGKVLYRGVFGTQKPGGWLANCFDLKNKEIANTNVIYWGDKLLALWEASEPYRLDPQTLDTLGKDYLDGGLAEGDAFSAHPRFDPSSQLDGGKPCLVNFSVKPNGLSTTITIFELDTTGKVIRKHAHSVPGFAFIHDFAITPNYCIFFQNSVGFNPLPFVLGMAGAGQCVKFQPQKSTRVLVIPRNPKNREIKTLETQSGFVFHHVNAFERGDEIIMDSVCYESLPELEPGTDFRQIDFDAIAPGKLWRFHLNIQDGTVKQELLEDRCCEFPSIHPQNVGKSYRYLYIGAAHLSTGNAPLQAVEKIDLETGEKQIWSAAPRGFAGEPLFVPRPDATAEDDGWVLAVIYDGENHRSDVVILDAQDLCRGAIARLHLKHHIPYGLHGNFTEKVFVS